MSVSQEREHLEHIYIDYLRREYPSLEKFREYATNRFQQDQYAIKDRTEEWSRDVRACVLSHMAFPDIIRLCKTNKKWMTVIHSSSYNGFWQSMYLRDFYNYVPTGNGVIPFAEITRAAQQPVVKKRRTKKVQSASVSLKTVLWFDLYLYTWSRLRHIFPLKKRTFRTFISHKYQADVPNGFPEMSFSSSNRTEDLLPLKAFPSSITNLVNLNQRKSMSAYNLSARLFETKSIFTNGVRLDNYTLYVPERCLQKSIEFLFDEESVIFKLLSETKSKWNLNKSKFLISQPTYIYRLHEAMYIALTPTEDVMRKYQWEHFFTSLSAR